jgi:hypothetical protein
VDRSRYKQIELLAFVCIESLLALYRMAEIKRKQEFQQSWRQDLRFRKHMREAMPNYSTYSNSDLLKELDRLKERKRNATIQATKSDINSDIRKIVRILSQRGL